MIYLFNKRKQLTNIITRQYLYNAVQSKVLNGLYTLSFEVPITFTNKEGTFRNFKKNIDNAVFVGHFDAKDRFQLYKIHDRNLQNKTIVVDAVHVFFDDAKASKIIQDIRPNKKQAHEMAQLTLPLAWRIKDYDVTPARDMTFYYQTPLDARKDIIETFQVEYDYGLQFDGNKIISYDVYVKTKLGAFSGQRFNYGANILSVEEKQSDAEIYTAVIGRGKGEEVGDGYGRRITFEDIEMTLDGVKKPKGQNYVEIPTATAEYGYADENGNVTPRIAVIEFDEIEDKTELLKASHAWLKQNCLPKVLYDVTVADLKVKNLDLGDSVHVIYKSIGLYQTPRVEAIEYNLLDPNKTQIKLGDYRYFKTDKVQANTKAQIERIENFTKDNLYRLKIEFDENFEAQKQLIKNQFDLAVTEATAQIEASEQRMKDRADEIERQTSQNLADFSNTFTEYADNIRTETKQYADILNASVTQSVTTLRSALDNAEGTISTITNDLSSVKTQVGTIGRDYVKSAELNVLSGEIQKRVLKSEYDAFTDRTTRKLNETVSTAEGNSTLIAQATGRIDDLAKWRADKGQAIEETIDSYSRKIWRDDIDNLKIGGRNLITLSSVSRALTSVNGYKYTLTKTGSSHPYVRIPHNLFENDTEYVITFKAKKISGNVYRLAGHSTLAVHSSVRLFIDGVEQTDKLSLGWSNVGTANYPNDNEVHQYEIRFKTESDMASVGTPYWYIQPNRPQYNSDSFVLEIWDWQLEEGNKPTDWTPAQEDAEARITEIKQTADRVALQAQSITDDYVKQSGVVVTGDKVQIGSKIVNGDVLASLITVSPNAIDVITDNLNLKGSLTVTNQIKTMALDAVYADIAKLRTRMLVADVITADMVKFDTALIEKFTSSTAFINSLTAKSAFINTAKVTELISTDGRDSFTLAGGMMNWVRSTGQTMQLGIDGIYMKNSDGSIRYQVDRQMVTSAALGTSNSNVYLATDTGYEARVVDRNQLPGSGHINDYTYRPMRALIYRFPDVAHAYFTLYNGGEFRFTGETTGAGAVYQDVRANVFHGAGFRTTSTNLYLGTDNLVNIVNKGFVDGSTGSPIYRDLRANDIYNRALITTTEHAYIGADGELRIVNKGLSGIYRDVRASGYYGTFLETTATNMYVRASGEVRFTANGTTGTYIPIRFKEWTATSHERHKREIADWNYSVLDIFKNDLKLKCFKFIDEVGSIYDRFRHGIVIRTDSNLDEFPVEWRNGDGFDGNEVMWWNTKAIQELAHENDTLKAEIAELKSQINKIMEMIA